MGVKAKMRGPEMQCENEMTRLSAVAGRATLPAVNRELLQMPSCTPPAALNVLLWPVAAPKNRVGGSPIFSFVFAFQQIGETLDTPGENEGCGYDFASGVHKYLYAEDDPVDMDDPSGHGLGDVLVTIGGIASLAAMNIQVIVNSMGGVAVATAVWQTSYDENAGSGPLVATAMAGLNFTPGEELGMVTKVGGKIVGKAFAAGDLTRVATEFAERWFVSTGGRMSLKTADGTIITLDKGTNWKGFQHILQGHLVSFWDGNLKKADISLWPISPDQMLQRLEEAASKYKMGGPVGQPIVLSDGTKVILAVANREVISFYPLIGQAGVVDGKALAAAAK
jgi:hypothetical protein